MKVKTLKAHTNACGAHKVGDIYEHPRPETDLHFGYIIEAQKAEPVKPAAEPKPKGD